MPLPSIMPLFHFSRPAPDYKEKMTRRGLSQLGCKHDWLMASSEAQTLSIPMKKLSIAMATLDNGCQLLSFLL